MSDNLWRTINSFLLPQVLYCSCPRTGGPKAHLRAMQLHTRAAHAGRVARHGPGRAPRNRRGAAQRGAAQRRGRHTGGLAGHARRQVGIEAGAGAGARVGAQRRVVRRGRAVRLRAAPAVHCHAL
jgi:hypothetical protein